MRTRLWVLLPLMVAACAPFRTELSPDVQSVARSSGGSSGQNQVLAYKGESADEEPGFQYALQTRNEFTTARGHIEGFQEGSGATALGLGAGTGAAVAFGGSTAMLKGLALGAAGLLGLREYANPAIKGAIYSRGVDAIDCAYEVAKAVKLAKDTNFQLTGDQFQILNSVPFSETAPSQLSQDIKSLDAAKTVDEKLQAALSLQKSLAFASAASRIQALTGDLHSAAVGLQHSIADAKEPTASDKQSSRLTPIVRKIKENVHNQLNAATPDPSAIMNRLRDSIAKEYEAVLKQRQAVKETKKELLKTLGDAAGAARDKNALLAIRQAEEALSKDIAKLDALDSAFDHCVGRLAPPEDKS